MERRIILEILIKPLQKSARDHLVLIIGFSLKIHQMYEDQSSEGLRLQGCIIEQQYLANANTLVCLLSLPTSYENNLAPLSG